MRGMWSAPGITPSRARSSPDRVSMSSAPSPCAARASSGPSRSSSARASRRRSSIVVRDSPSATVVAAILARAAQDDVVCCDGVAAPVGDPLDRRLEPGVLERLDLPAVVAHEVVVVIAVRRARARNVRHRRRGRSAGRARARPSRRALGRRSRFRHALPRARAASWISCAERQQSCSPRSSTTSRRAPPLRPLASRSRASAVSLHVMSIMIPVLKDVLRSAAVRRLLVLPVLLATLALAGCCVDAEDSLSSRGSIVASFYPLAWATEQVAGWLAHGRQPHAARCRAARRRAVAERRRDDSQTPNSSSTSAAASSLRSRMRVESRGGRSLDLLRPGRGSAHLAGPDSLRAGRRADRASCRWCRARRPTRLVS